VDQSWTTTPSLRNLNWITPPTQPPGRLDPEASSVIRSPRSTTPSPLASRRTSEAVVPWSPWVGLQTPGQVPGRGVFRSGIGLAWLTRTPVIMMSSTHQPSSRTELLQLDTGVAPSSYDCAVALNSHDCAIQRIRTLCPMKLDRSNRLCTQLP